MNIKIKSAGVACLLGDNYDRIYTAIKKQIGQGSDSLFTERTPGNDYLQWELPGDGWADLNSCDPIRKGEIKKELIRRQSAVRSLFVNNDELAQKILSVPDDSYIYYKIDDNGHIDIKLTVWGYQYPERVSSTAGSGDIQPKSTTEHTSIYIEYAGKPYAGKSFLLNGLKRETDANGKLDVGELPEGYQFELDIDGQKKSVIVSKGNGNITIDLTKYTTVEVKVNRDGNPCFGAAVILNYGSIHQELTTDAAGMAMTKLPLSINGDICKVSVENETQQDQLTELPKLFNFEFVTPVTPKPAEIVNPPVEEEKPEDNPPVEEEKPEDNPPVEEKKTEPNPPVEEEKPEEEKSKTSFWIYLFEILLALLLVILTLYTFYLSAGLLFG